MEAMFIKILSGIALRLLSEKLIIGLAMHGISAIVKKTGNTVDDDVFCEVAEALGRPDIADKVRDNVPKP